MFKTTAINYLKSVAAFHSPISDIKLFTKKSKKLPEKKLGKIEIVMLETYFYLTYLKIDNMS